MSERTRKRTSAQISEWANERTIDGTNERVSERTRKQMIDETNKRASERLTERTNERINEWASEQSNEWKNKWKTEGRKNAKELTSERIYHFFHCAFIMVNCFTLFFVLQGVADLPSEYWQIQRLVRFLKVRVCHLTNGTHTNTKKKCYPTDS